MATRHPVIEYRSTDRGRRWLRYPWRHVDALRYRQEGLASVLLALTREFGPAGFEFRSPEDTPQINLQEVDPWNLSTT